MSTPWIITSKLEPPAPADALVRTLWPAPLPRALALVAGPGYGKTLGLWQVAREAADGAPVVWLGLDEQDADPATCFHYLLAGVQAHIPQFGQELQALLAAERLEWRGLWQRFFQALASFNLPRLVLALDDVHHLVAPPGEGFKALAYFLDKLPAGIHVYLGSRKRLPGALVARGKLDVLDQAALRFDPAEQSAYLQLRAAGEVPPEWARQAELLEGWPLGLELITRRHPREETWPAGGEGRELDRLTDYLAGEVFAALPEGQRAFLLAIAPLQTPTPDACRAIVPAADAAERLEALVDDHLAQRLAGGSYRLSAYLREFLLAEAERGLPADARAALHARAAAYYRERGQAEAALPHLIASRAWDDAARACREAFPAMLYSGRAAQVERWVASFPPEALARAPHLQLWLAHTEARAGRVQEAAAAYETALQACRERDDARGAFKALVRLAPIYLRRNDTRAAGRLLLQGQATQHEADAEDLVDFQLARALAAEQRGDEATVRECNLAALGVAVDDNVEIAASHCIAHLNLYSFALHQGDLPLARHHLGRALALADTWRFGPYHLFASFMLAHVHLVEGNLAAAGALLAGLPPYWRDVLDWHDRACADTVLGHYHQLAGDWKQAEAALLRARRGFERGGYLEGKKLPAERLLWLALQRRQYARASEIVADAGPLERGSVHDLALVVPWARARQLAGDAAGALDMLEGALPELERLDARLLLARARLFEAAARLGLGDRPAASHALEAARELCRTHGYAFLLEQDQALWEELGALAGNAVEAGGDEPSTLDRLTLHCFGPLEVRRGGLLLDHWPRRKAKLILAALALHPRGLTMTELLELVWHDEPKAGSQTVLKVAVSALRRTLEPELIQGEASRYVQLVEDRYVLVAEAVEAVDVWRFEAGFARAKRERDPARTAAAYEEALAELRGPLLDNPFFASFFDAEREGYRKQALAALHWLADYHRGRGESDAVEGALARATALAPCDEEAYVALMRHYKHTGRPERVRQVYWDCRKAFKQHLGLAPPPELDAAYAAISGG